MMRWKEHYNPIAPVAKDSIHQFKQFYSLIEIKLHESCLLVVVLQFRFLVEIYEHMLMETSSVSVA